MINIKRIILIVTLLIISVSGLYFWNANKVQWKIRLDLDFFHPETEVIDLNSYTNFDWDNVLVFKRIVFREEIEDTLAVKLNFPERKLDLSSGIVFEKNGKIVHYEFFPFAYNKAATFALYPYADEDEVQKIQVFSVNEAVFRVSRIGRNDGRICYALIPLKE